MLVGLATAGSNLVKSDLEKFLNYHYLSKNDDSR
jgi:hypothetical protein